MLMIKILKMLIKMLIYVDLVFAESIADINQ